MTNLSDLLRRVEEASGPDRELDARVYVALIARLQNPVVDRMIEERAALRPEANVWLDGARDWQVKPYTASLDAALALCERVLPGWCWDIGNYNGSGQVNAFVVDPEITDGQEIDSWGSAKTPAIALLAAMLKALIAQGKGGEQP